MQKKNLLLKLFLLFFSFASFSQSEGEKLFKINKPDQAIPLLEEDIKNGSVSVDTYYFLGLSYIQIGEYNKAIEIFDSGIKNASGSKKLLAFSQGLACYSIKDYKKAETAFSLALAASPDFYPALLNRANTRLMAQEYQEALSDYKKYITDLPDDPQEPEIRKLISYLEEELVRQEQEAERLREEPLRLEEENRRMHEEIARQKAEEELREAEKRRLEEERRRKLLEDVANSLKQTDATNMTAGAEDVLEYEYESELE